MPVLGATPGTAVAPPLLSGHGLQATNQVVLGASTLRSLHKQLGDTVHVRIHGSKPVTLTIVGTAHTPSDRRRGLVAPGDGHRRHALLPDHPGPGTEPLREQDARAERHPGPDKGGQRAAPHWRRCSPSGAGWASPQRRLRVRGAAPGRDHELRLSWYHASAAGRRPGGGCGSRARHHARHIGPASSARPGHPQDARLHQGPARHRRGRAGERRRRHRMRRRDPRRDRSGPGALGPLRRQTSTPCLRPLSRAGRCSWSGSSPSHWRSSLP